MNKTNVQSILTKLRLYLSEKNNTLGGNPKQPMSLKNALVIILLAGILLMVLIWPVSDKKSKDKEEITVPAGGTSVNSVHNIPKEKNTASDENEHLYAYHNKITKELEAIIGVMDGVGEVRVMLTLESDGKIVVEKDTSQQKDIQKEDDAKGGKRENSSTQFSENTIYTQDTESPFVIQTLTPRVTGVVIAAEGGDNPVIQKNITEAICALFDIEIHKIRVVKMAKP